MNEFPGNASKGKRPALPDKKKEPDAEKVIEKVVSGEVIQRKKSFGMKVREVFIGGEFKSASSYIMAEVLLPALRNMIVDSTTKGIERMIYGDNVPRRQSLGAHRSRVQYNTPIDRYTPQQRAYLPGQSAHVPLRKQDVPDIILISREDAEMVVERLGDIIAQYDVASVSDLKHLVGLPDTYVDNNWGWTSVHFIDIRQVRDGWLLILPNTEPI